MRFARANEIQDLLKQPTYREFLNRSFELMKSGNSRFSYALFVRKAGLVSRSFPRDVILGKKRLTADSAARFALALGLTGDLKSYFLMLVALEEPGVRPLHFSPEEVSQRLAVLRKKLWSKAGELDRPPVPSFYDMRYWLEVYAALGTVEDGASLEDVSRRTRLRPSVCRSVLEGMVEKKVAELSPTGRFLPRQMHLVFSHIGEDLYFKNWYLRSLSEARRRAEVKFKSDSDLFFNSVFSVAESRLKELKSDLRELLLRYVEGAENPHGDTVAKLSVALFARG